MTLWQRQETAVEWDAGGAGQLPTRQEQQELLLALLAGAEIDGGAVLDLGIGSGLVAEDVLDALPDAHLVGVDFSPAMLDLARTRLSRFGSRVQLLNHNLADLDSIDLPALRYRAAFSVQTMHHLPDPGKASALAWTASIVEPGGLVVVIDRVKVDELLFRDWAIVWPPPRLEDTPNVCRACRGVHACRRPARTTAGPTRMDGNGRPRRLLPPSLREPSGHRRAQA